MVEDPVTRTRKHLDLGVCLVRFRPIGLSLIQ